MIKYFENRALLSTDLAKLYISSGVERPITDLIRLQKMLDNSNLHITAWDDQELVGIARAVTDFGYCCYLSDLAVDMAYQGSGIGKSLIALMRKTIGLDVSLILISSPKTSGFYKKLGFKWVENGYSIEGSL